MSRSKAHLTHEDRSRRRKLAFLAAGVVVVIGGWVAAVALIGGPGPAGSGGEGGDRQALAEGGGSPGSSLATTVRQGPEDHQDRGKGGDGPPGEQSSPSSSPQDPRGGGKEGQPQPTPARKTSGSAPDEHSPGDGATRGMDVLSSEGAGGREGSSGDPGDGPPEPSPEAGPGPASPTTTGPGDDANREKADSETTDSAIEENKKKGIEKTYVTPPPPPSQEGVGNREGGGEGSGEKLTGRQDERVRAAAGEFIAAAYGYTGTDKEAYLSGIEGAAASGIYESPGGERLAEYASYGPDCGMISTAALRRLEVVEAAPEWVAVTAYFTVEDGGVTHRFAQRQMLSADGGGDYEVSGVGVEELVSDTHPRESCPGGEVSVEEVQKAKQAVRGHYEAIGAGEFEEAYSYFGPAFRREVPKKGWIETHRQDGIKDATVHSVELARFSGQKGEAEVGVSFSDGSGRSSFDLTWEMVKTAGEWKLDELKSGDRKGDRQ